MSVRLYENEKVVLSIVQEYIKENRYFTIDKILPYINVRLKKFEIFLNYAGIKKILVFLIKQKLILERSKLSKDEILDNENRKAIFDIITDTPGLYFNRIASELKISNYILAWHIKMLIKFNFIRTKSFENHEVFFNATLNEENDELIFIISRDKSKQIIDYLQKHQEGVSKTQISRDLGIHSTTVSNYTEVLEKKRIIIKKKLPRKTIYFLNERFYYDIMRS